MRWDFIKDPQSNNNHADLDKSAWYFFSAKQKQFAVADCFLFVHWRRGRDLNPGTL
jgi:hypothetical protein